MAVLHFLYSIGPLYLGPRNIIFKFVREVHLDVENAETSRVLPQTVS